MLGARRWFAIAALAALLVTVAGCAGTKRSVYLDREANFGAVERVAVLPFDNFTSDVHAPEKVHQILTIELLSAGVFELVDTADTRRALGEAQVAKTSEMTSEQVRQLGQKLEAQALLVGTVQELSLDRSSGVAAPTISLQFKMLDTGTGATIWSSVVSRQGPGTSARLFGVGGKGLNEALRDLVRSGLKTLIKK